MHLFSGAVEYNDFHPYIEYSKDNYSVGATINSHNDTSFYAKYRQQNTKDIWVDYGLVTGYEGYPVLPFGRLGYKDSWVMPNLDGIVVGSDYDIMNWKQ